MIVSIKAAHIVVKNSDKVLMEGIMVNLKVGSSERSPVVGSHESLGKRLENFFGMGSTSFR